MVGNPETPGISPDTPDLEHSGEKLRVLIRILRKFRIEVRIFRILQKCGRRVVSGSGSCIRFRLVSKYKSYCMHSHVICIRVDAATEGSVYEVIAGP